MPCVGGCSASFVQKTWQQTHFSGILSKGKPLRILQLSWWLHVTTLPGPYTDSSRMPHVRVSSLWVLAGMLWKTRQVSRLVMPSSSSLTTSLPHVDRGGVTAAAASSGVGWRQCGLNLAVGGACAFSDAVHKMEEHALHGLPIQGPRTTHWLLLEIARGELGASGAAALVNSIFRTWLWVKFV